MTYKPYPKWLHFDGEPSVLVEDEAEHEAVMAARLPAADVEPEVPKRKGGRPKKDIEADTESEGEEPPEATAEHGAE